MANTRKSSNEKKTSIERPEWPEVFSADVLAEALSFGLEPDMGDIEAAVIGGRRDYRNRRTITIDGEDAKDLDDAVDIEPLEKGRFRLGVHIADVAHYVTEGSALDREALQRGTSVYPVGRVIPMLPPGLSNGICSLNPDRDRLTLSVIMTIGPDGQIEEGEIAESVIRSKARATYAEVRQVLEDGVEPVARYRGFRADLLHMRSLADILSEQRRKRGAIDFDFPETRVEIDAEGRPISIGSYQTSIANEIIESFMIAANEFVARHYFFAKIPFIFRVHELPDKEKLTRFIRLAAVFGVKTRIRGTATPGQLAAALKQVRHEPYGPTLSELLLRSLAKARYASHNLGHFGLASEFYCHFTSPIRRYPDLFIHRMIKATLNGREIRKLWRETAPLIAEQSSEAERGAMQIERDSIAEKMAEFMAGKLGDVFEGVISGFGPAGIYVRLASTVEGMIPYRSLEGYYVFDEERLRATDHAGRRTFGIGDSVRVQVARADVKLRQIDFELQAHEGRELPTVSSPTGGGNKGRTTQKKKAAPGKTAAIKSRQKQRKNRKRR